MTLVRRRRKPGPLPVTPSGLNDKPATTPPGPEPRAPRPAKLSVYAGLIAGGCSDGPGNAARFFTPNAVAVGPQGELYIADQGNNTIRKITPAGVVSTFAGTPGVAGSTNGTGSAARFNGPNDIAIDAAGQLLVSDGNNNTIRKITRSGVVTTLAGTAGVAGSADGPGASATFNSPCGLALDRAGTLYVADSNNNTIRKITPAGRVSTFAGTAGLTGSADGPGASARFNNLNGLAMAASGNLVAADSGNNTIRQITRMGVVSTLAGTAGPSGDRDGTGAAARFDFPMGLAVDPLGNLYVAEEMGQVIRKITPSRVVTTLAGTGGVPGYADGPSASARFNGPASLAVDRAGNIYVAEAWNNTIRKISPAGEVSTVAGSGPTSSVDGTRTSARFNMPKGLVVDGAGNLVVADCHGQTIRKVTPAGDVTTLAGAAGVEGSADGPGTAARFRHPIDVALDGAGNIYVADSYHYTIRKLTPSGVVSTLAGTAGTLGSADGLGAAASFGAVTALTVDGAGNLYVAESDANTIRKVTPAGAVTTLAGTAGTTGSANGIGAAASFNLPADVELDASGNLYVADFFNATIRKVTPEGVVSTVAGTPEVTGYADGTGAAARFNQPMGLAMTASGHLYVADSLNHTIRMITPEGVVTTVAGVPGVNRTVPGALPGCWFAPYGLAVDPATGALFASTDDAILKVVL